MGKQTSLLSFTTVATVRPGQPAAQAPSASGSGRPARNEVSDAHCSTRERLKENEAPQLANSSCDGHGFARSGEDSNEEDVHQLVAMGFARGDCVAALTQTSHDLSAAVNKLLGGFTAASVRRDEQTSSTRRISPKRKSRQVEESLDQRLARRRVQTALSRSDDGDAPSADTRWPLRGPARQAPTAPPVVAVEQLEHSPAAHAPLAPIAASTEQESKTGLLDDVAGSQWGTSSPQWKPLDASMLQGAPRVLVPKLSEPGKASDPAGLPATTTVERATDVVTCPLCGARVQRGKLAKHMASESVDAPLEDEDVDLEYEDATASGAARQNTDSGLGAQLGAPKLESSRDNQPDHLDLVGAAEEQEVLVFDSSDDEVAVADTGDAVDVPSDGTNLQPEPHAGLSYGLAPSGLRVDSGVDDVAGDSSRLEGSSSDTATDAYDFWQPMTKKPPQAGSTGHQQSIINYSAMMQPGAAGAAGSAVAAAGNGSAGRLHPEAVLNPEATAAGFRVKPRARGATKKVKSNATSGKSGAGRGRGRGGGKGGKKKFEPRGGWGKYWRGRRGRG
eukprot:COSAG02_NODE_619_length_19446_cov_9.557141_17_plen_561_part_00